MVVAVLCATVSDAGQGTAGNSQSGPVVKAVYLVNFARFTEWPSRSEGRLSLCVLGDPQVAAILAQLVDGRPINGREASVSRIDTLRIAPSCHLLYISGDQPSQIADAIQAVANLQVFTVGENEAFIKVGGIAALYTEEGRTRFAINAQALSRAGLKVSSQMMGLARLVKGQAR